MPYAIVASSNTRVNGQAAAAPAPRAPAGLPRSGCATRRLGARSAWAFRNLLIFTRHPLEQGPVDGPRAACRIRRILSQALPCREDDALAVISLVLGVWID